VKEDDAKSESRERLVVMYVEREDGSFGPLQTGSQLVERFKSDLDGKLEVFRQQFSQRLQAGETSPVGYYRELVNISEADLASRMGISRRKLRKHALPAGFRKLSDDQLARYADIFGIPVQELLRVPLPGGGCFDARGER